MIKDAIAKDTCFVQRHGPTALCLRDLTKKMASEKLGEAPLGLLKQTSFVVQGVRWQSDGRLAYAQLPAARLGAFAL